jgi:rod shape-determining protein MreD
MSKWVIAVISIVAAVVLQAAVLPVHIASPFKPDLLLIFVVYLG